MGEVVVFVVGAAVGSLLTFLFNLRADKIRWARRARQELYATAIRKMQQLETAANEYRRALRAEAYLDAMLAEDEVDPSDSRVHAMREKDVERQRTKQQEVLSLRDELNRMSPEFEMIASPAMRRWFRYYTIKSYELAWDPRHTDEDADLSEAVERYEALLSGVREVDQDFVRRATDELGLPAQRPLKSYVRTAWSGISRRFDSARERIAGIFRRQRGEEGEE